MGLLDALLQGFQGDYGGQNGGILDLIRRSQDQNSQYQPSDGLPPMQPPASFADRFGAMPGAPPMFTPAPQSINQADYDPQTFAPNQAQPIGVGSYQMPRIGDAGQFTPPEQAAAALPQNAQPTQGQVPAAPSTDVSAQSRQPQQQLPPALGGGAPQNGFLRGMQSVARGGGLISALTGNYNDPQSVQQQNLSAQHQAITQALIANGDTPQVASSKAMIAVMNPEAAKTILPELFTTKEQFKTIKDGFGGEKPAFVNERDQTINGRPIAEFNKQSASGDVQQTFDAIQKAREGGATPAQLYQMVPAQLRDGVQAMIEGRGIPTNLSARGDARNQAIMLAHTIDPTFDESQIPSRVQGNKDFYGGGKSAETMRKTNQSALHFGELVDKMQTLPGTDIPAANAVANIVNTQLLGKGASGNFMVNAHALADELSTMFKGASISDAEIKAWESRLTPNMSDEQQRGMAKTLLGLYRDSVSALEKKRQESIGPVVAAQKGPILGPEAETALQKVQDFANGKPTQGAAPSSTGIDRSAIEAEMRKRGLMK